MDRHKLEQLRDKVGELIRHGSPSCIRQAQSIMNTEFENVLFFALEKTEPKPKPQHTIADNYPAGGIPEPCMFCEDFEELQAENDRLKEGYERIENWRKAYPLESFPKPDLKKAREVLKAAGMTLDAISADNMRHVLEGIKDIVAEALTGKG